MNARIILTLAPIWLGLVANAWSAPMWAPFQADMTPYPERYDTKEACEKGEVGKETVCELWDDDKHVSINHGAQGTNGDHLQSDDYDRSGENDIHPNHEGSAVYNMVTQLASGERQRVDLDYPSEEMCRLAGNEMMWREMIRAYDCIPGRGPHPE